jgi:hypothetical protein
MFVTPGVTRKKLLNLDFVAGPRGPLTVASDGKELLRPSGLYPPHLIGEKLEKRRSRLI